MATSKARRGGARKRVSGRAARPDAIALLKTDHRQVEKWFDEFESARSASRRQTLATSICTALRMHTILEEEIFYPAFFEATGDADIHHEALVEHDGAKKLIAEIEQGGPGDDYFVAKVNVLGEMIRHHVREEEKPGGMFGEAKKSKMDLEALGQEIQSRKQQLVSEMRPAQAA